MKAENLEGAYIKLSKNSVTILNKETYKTAGVLTRCTAVRDLDGVQFTRAMEQCKPIYHNRAIQEGFLRWIAAEKRVVLLYSLSDYDEMDHVNEKRLKLVADAEAAGILTVRIAKYFL